MLHPKSKHKIAQRPLNYSQIKNKKVLWLNHDFSQFSLGHLRFLFGGSVSWLGANERARACLCVCVCKECQYSILGSPHQNKASTK